MERHPVFGTMQEQLRTLRDLRNQHVEQPEVLWQRQGEVLNVLSTITETFVEALDARGSEHTQLVQQIATLAAKVEHVQDDIRGLCKMVRDGNGQPSIMQRLANVETTLNGQAKDLEQISQHANSIIANRMLTKAQLVAGLSGMIFTALLSFMALVATLIKS